MARVGEVCSINVSTEKGVVKTPLESAILVTDHGITGDAHAGPGIKQVSMLADESIDKMRAQTADKLHPGDFAENITTRGLVLHGLPIGTRFTIGKAVLEVSKIGKECHHGCAIQQKVGTCIMPLEGIFATVVYGAEIKKGDKICIVE